MNLRFGSVLLALAFTLAMSGVAMAQTDDGTPSPADVLPVDASSAVQQPGVPTSLFLTIVNPVELDVEVPLDTAQLTIQGMTSPGAVVSVNGDLLDVDDQGNFGGAAALEQGANEIEVVASDDQGNQIDTSLFITRGE